MTNVEANPTKLVCPECDSSVVGPDASSCPTCGFPISEVLRPCQSYRAKWQKSGLREVNSEQIEGSVVEIFQKCEGTILVVKNDEEFGVAFVHGKADIVPGSVGELNFRAPFVADFEQPRRKQPDESKIRDGDGSGKNPGGTKEPADSPSLIIKPKSPKRNYPFSIHALGALIVVSAVGAFLGSMFSWQEVHSSPEGQAFWLRVTVGWVAAGVFWTIVLAALQHTAKAVWDIREILINSTD